MFGLETPPCSRNLRYEALARSDQKSQNVRLRRANTVIFKGKTALLEGKKLKIFRLRRANTWICKDKTALLGQILGPPQAENFGVFRALVRGKRFKKGPFWSSKNGGKLSEIFVNISTAS